MTTKTKAFLVLILILTVFFRFYQLQTLPGGLFPDEAANGLDINSMQQGHLQPFYDRGNGREALFFYMLWGSVEAFGKGPWQHHAVSALVGTLSVLFCFLAARKLMQVGEVLDEETNSRADTVGLIAAFLMAVSSWHIVLSRTAFRANLIPLFAALAVYLLLKTFFASSTKKRILWAALFGASFALGFYSYIAYRILVPIVATVVLWPLLATLRGENFGLQVKKYFLPFVFCAAAFIIFIFPLAKYFYTHPGSFVGRSGQVSVFNPELNQGHLAGAIWEVSKLSVLGYFTQGDLNWRHNISGQPFLSNIVSPFFGVTLAVTTLLAVWYLFAPFRHPKFWKYFLLAGWFWGMLVPVVTTAEGIPHGLRAIGTIPAVFIISAIGLYYFASFVLKLHQKLHAKRYPSFGHHWQYSLQGWGSPVVKMGYKLVVVVFFAVLIVQAYSSYFVYAANSPEYYYSFRSDLTRVSEYLKQFGNKDTTYLILDKFSLQTVEYFTSVDARHPENPKNQPYQQVDPEDSWQLGNLSTGDKIVFTQSSIFDIKKFKLYHPEAALIYEVRNKFGQAILAVYEVN